MKIQINKKAPNFKLPSTNGNLFELNKIKNKNIILYFYPKDDTPGCTLESKDFSKLNTMILRKIQLCMEFRRYNWKSLKFKKKYNIKFDLLSDVNKKVLKKYDVWKQKTFMGKKYMGIVRSIFLIKKNRIVHKIWNNVRVKDHAKDVYSEIKKIV